MQAKVRTVAFPGHRRPAGRRAGAGGAGPARLRHGRPGRQGGGREPRAGAGGVPGAGPGAAAAAHHRQPLAGRPRQGGQPLRPADRARPAGRHGRDPAGKPGAMSWRWANWRSTARSRRVPGVLPAALIAAGSGARPDLPGGVRRRSGLGRLRAAMTTGADRRRALAARADQPPARPADPAARRRRCVADDARHLSRSRRDQGPGDAPSACSRSRRPAATTC